MVWIDPTERNTIPDFNNNIWLSIQEEEGFILQQYQPHLDINKDYNEINPFRIILRATHLNLLIAHDNDFSCIIDHWKWLEEYIFKPIKLLDDLPEEELFQFVILKISSLVKSSEEITTIPNLDNQSNEIFFSNIYPKLKLIEHYSCSLWEDTLLKGVLYLNIQHCFFYSTITQKSIVIPFVEIIEIVQNIEGMIPNSIQISTLYGAKYLFSNLNDINQVYTILYGLWDYCIFCNLQKIERDMQDLNWELDIEEDCESPPRLELPSENSSFSTIFQFNQDTITKDGVLHYMKNKDFRTKFNLPRSEQLLSSHTCILEGWGPGYIKDINGILYVSDHFICFYSLYIEDSISAVITSTEIYNIEYRIPDKLIITTENVIFKFSKIPQESLILKEINLLWDEYWKNNVVNDVSQVRESLSTQARISREKQNFFRGSISNLSDKQHEKWDNYVKVNGMGLVLIRTPELKELVRDGLPRKFRGKLWQCLSGSLYRKTFWPLEYRNVVKDSINETTLASEEIGRDINRTFPEHPFFQKESGRELLERILKAYSFRNPSIGYCQSMNIVCAFQMLFMSDEDTYWMLSTVCEDMLPDYYAPSMIGSTTDQQVFEYLLKKYLSDIYNHFIELCIPITLITIPWLLCTFIGFLSWEVTLRILDCFFYEGRKIFFQIGLSIFKIYKSRILSYNDPVDIIELLKNSDIESTLLFKVAFNDFKDITEDLINSIFTKQRTLVVNDLKIKLEKRKQTAALQLSNKKYKIRRTSSLEFKSEIIIPASPRKKVNLRKQLAKSTSLISVPKQLSKLYKGTEEVFRFRSSSQAPIEFSTAFKPGEID